MRVGINRNRIDIDVMGTVFTIGIVPIHAHKLIAEHDNLDEDDSAEAVEKKVEFMFECVEDILIANGYEFIRSWWEKMCDFTMLREFVVFSLQKDIPPTKGKKKAKVDR
jgi:hypothetical protein